MKLKKKVKKIVRLIIILVILISYFIAKLIILNDYNYSYKSVKELTKQGTVLDKTNLEPYNSNQSIFLDKVYKIGIEYNDINKIGNNNYKITNLNNITYSIKYTIKDGKDLYKEYYDMINNINRLTKKKNNLLTPIITIKKNSNSLNEIKNNIPKYDEIAILDGHDYNGYIYKIDNVYNSVLYGDNKIIEISFEGDKLEYEYIINVLSTLEKD